MSLFSSLTTAITGLDAQQEAIGNISDNISNANTIGFKQIDTSFQNLVTESTPQFNAPGGVRATPLYQNNVPGNLTPSSVNTSLAINGQGFFQVKAPPPATAQGTNPTFSQQNLYTQAGDFALNSNGFLVNSAGYYLTGYNVNPQTQAVDTSNTGPIQISQLTDAPQPTANLTLGANLPSSYAFQNTSVGPPAVPNPSYVAPSPITTQVFDATGASHTETIQFNHPDPTKPNVWTATIYDVSPSAGDTAINTAGQPTDSPAQLTLTFSDGSGAFPGLPAGTLAKITDNTATAFPPTAGPPAVTNPLVTPSAAAAGSPATFTIAQDFGAGPQTIKFNFGTYGTTTGVTGDAGSTVTSSGTTQDGVARGQFQSLSIDDNGFVNINYTNGQTKSFYQVAVAQFNAPDQLQRVQGSAFGATLDSGVPNLNPPGVNGNGTISPSTLEESNVDIATEFTKLITAQQVYSANSKVITTANQLLTTVIGLIQ